MKSWLIIPLIIGLMCTTARGQMTDLGGPKSWSEKSLRTRIDFHSMPSFDLEAQQAQDRLNDATGKLPWQFGYEHTLNLDLNNSGTWSQLSSGDRIWQIDLYSAGALTINLIFEEYELPKGATLHLYNPETKAYIGAYTHDNNTADGMFGSSLIDGERVVVEYYEPKEVAGQGRLKLSMLVHGYRELGSYPEERYSRALNDAGACNLDVNCPLGLGWQDQINSVGLIITGGSAACTGALINNTRNDGTPYFLSANHCGTSGAGSWVFRFNWDSPVAICAQNGNSVDPGAPYNEVNGAVLRANRQQSDFALFELNSLPTSGVYLSGWDRSTIPATQATGIHHPRGDVKKICREDDPLVPTSSGVIAWDVQDWDQGVTEPGSSGSPLFNQNKLIIGQLYGGGAACSGLTDNGQSDSYGRLDASWNGADPSQRLVDWLDPTGSGALTFQGYDPYGNGLPIDAGVVRISGIPNSSCGIDSFMPAITIQNYGTDTLQQVSLIYAIDSVTVDTILWTGNLNPRGVAVVTLNTFGVGSGTHTFSAQTWMPNSMVDSNDLNDQMIFTFVVNLNGRSIDYTLATDCYGSETSWSLADSATGAILYSGGPYSNNFSSRDSIRNTFCLAGGCYKLTIYDSYGDGLDGTGSSFCGRSGDYWITDDAGVELVRMNAPSGNFGDSVSHYFCVSPFLDIEELSLHPADLQVFPNPTQGQFTARLDYTSKIRASQWQIFSATGILLQERQLDRTLDHQWQVDLSAYPPGVYLFKLHVEGGIYIAKVIRS